MSPLKFFNNSKTIFFYFLLIFNLIFFPTSAISKIVGDKIFIGTTFSLSGENSPDSKSFKIKIDKPFELNQNHSIEEISETLNRWLEKKILNNPNQWIWSHNRWK